MKTPFPAFLPWSLVNQWIYPKHIYEGTDPRQNERNYKNPVGIGPVRASSEWCAAATSSWSAIRITT